MNIIGTLFIRISIQLYRTQVGDTDCLLIAMHLNFFNFLHTDWLPCNSTDLDN